MGPRGGHTTFQTHKQWLIIKEHNFLVSYCGFSFFCIKLRTT